MKNKIMGKYWAYNRPLTSIEARQRKELFQSEGFQKWLEEKIEPQTVSGESDCCESPVIDDVERCSECGENCERVE